MLSVVGLWLVVVVVDAQSGPPWLRMSCSAVGSSVRASYWAPSLCLDTAGHLQCDGNCGRSPCTQFKMPADIYSGLRALHHCPY